MSVFGGKEVCGTGEFPSQRDSNAENAAIWWRQHVTTHFLVLPGA